jgi:hypothetical protein
MYLLSSLHAFISSFIMREAIFSVAIRLSQAIPLAPDQLLIFSPPEYAERHHSSGSVRAFLPVIGE